MARQKWIFILVGMLLIAPLSESVNAARLPTIGGDNDTWGDLLNQFLNITLSPTGWFWPDIINNTFIADGTIRNEDLAEDANISVSKIENLNNKIVLDISNITNFTFNYNQTTPAISYTNASLLDYYNRTDIQLIYYNRSEVDAKGYANTTQLQGYNESVLISSVNQSMFTILSTKLNFSDQRYNETTLIAGINTTLNSQISGLPAVNSTFNQTLTNTLYASIVWNYNQTTSAIDYCTANFYNKTQVDANLSLYYLLSNPNNYLNITSISNSTIARTANCSSGQFVQNTTTGGVQCATPTTALATASVNSTHLVDLTIVAADIANGVITAAKLVTGIITADYIAVGAVNTTHILDGTISETDLSPTSVNSTHIRDGSIQGVDINSNANLSVRNITAVLVDLGLETKTAECSTNGCTATATCTSGKVILFGYGTTGSLLGGISLGSADVECTTGATACSATDNQALTNTASVKIICARVQ